MPDFTLHGGYSYSVGEPEQFDNVRAACDAWLDRFRSNGISKVDGVLWPTWGDMADDDYALTVEGDGITKHEIVRYGITGDLPFGWEPEVDSLVLANGTCDVCRAPIADQEQPGEPRLCSKDKSHDPYSDGFSNGGDPLYPEGYEGSETVQYVMVVTIEEHELDGDLSIENAARIVNMGLNGDFDGSLSINVRPLSEVIAS